jgi:membrane-bound serine protease (ClpP class)
LSKRLLALVIVIFLLFLITSPVIAEETQKVMIVPIEKTVEKGLSSFVQRAFTEANNENVDYIILEIDTPGGRIDAAKEIKDIIMGSDIPTAALVKSQALSAGSYIALSCDQIAMQPGSTLGDAEPRVGNEPADEKILSAWREELAAVAEANNRNPEIAKAFADRDMEIEGVITKGKLLTLTPNDAVKLGMADYQVSNREELLKVLGLEQAQILSADPTVAERISRLVTNPFVAPILLTVGIAGLIIEVLTAGFGLFGIIGFLSLVLFFGGHLIAGFSGWEAILLFVLGLIFMVVEAFFPGFGIFGIGGLLAFITSIILVSPSFEAALISLTIAIIGTIILVIVSMKFLTTRNFWKRLVLGNKLVTEEGYVASSQELPNYINQEGKALTTLRPAGTVELTNGHRLDVVTAGEFIEKDTPVKVIKVEGNRIIVKKID